MSDVVIPGWEKRPLFSLANYINGYSFGPEDWSDEGRVILRIQQLNNLFKNCDRFSGDLNSVYNVEYGDLIFSWSATLKAVIWKGEPAVLNQHLFKVVPVSGIDKGLLQQLLEFHMESLASLGQGSTMNHITRGNLESYFVHLPASLDEQLKIAKILTTIDNLIDKTQALIDKYTAIKQGMMTDLFTRGIDLSPGPDGRPDSNPNYGQLRPSYGEAPELYRDTSLGWIPKDWEVESSDQLCSRVCVGIVIKPTQYYTAHGVPALRSANIREKGLTSKNLVYISPESNRRLKKSQARTGDILSVRTGYPGTSAVVTNEFDGVNCVDIIISSPNDRVVSEFLCGWINSSFGKEQVLRLQGGIAQQHFNVGDMRDLKVALPSVNEQNIIVERIQSVEKILNKQESLKNKYLDSKKGLMQDLLTGNVRVVE